MFDDNSLCGPIDIDDVVDDDEVNDSSFSSIYVGQCICGGGRCLDCIC